MKTLGILLMAFLLIPFLSSAQEDYKEKSKEELAKIYAGGDAYEVKEFNDSKSKKKPRNVILLIGDGMGVSQVYAGLTANQGDLYLKNFTNIGFQTTYSANNYITDSAASGTALGSGEKTKNGAIGVDLDNTPIINIREKLEDRGYASGVVSTSAVTHATPASFVAHVESRNQYEDIAKDFVYSNIDVFLGGGYKHFSERADKVNYIDTLSAKGFQVCQDLDELKAIKSGKVAGLMSPEHMGPRNNRGDFLPLATEKAISLLSENKDGFFLMVEGSQIDWAGHQNNMGFLVGEVLDFDQSVGKALAFAVNDRETLVIVTADHETGGLGINGGNLNKGDVKGGFTTGGHTAVMVPVFAFGPGAEEFKGFYDNTDISKKILSLLGY